MAEISSVDINLPLTSLPSLSWPAIIDAIDGQSGEGYTDTDFFLKQTQNILQAGTEKISALVAGFAIGARLVDLYKRGCEVKGIVYDQEFLDEVAIDCIQNDCDIRLYLSLDRDVNDMRNIQLAILPGTAFLQIAQNRSKVQELLSFFNKVLADSAVIILEMGTLPAKLDRPYSITNTDGSVSTITQDIQTFYTGVAQIKETLSYEAGSDTERITVRNVRTFHIWEHAELAKIFQFNGFNVRIDNTVHKKYIVAYKRNYMPKRNNPWQKTKN